MSGSPRRRRNRRLLAELGAVPPVCVGHYALGDAECDGVARGPRCTWRGCCRVYKDLCQQRGLDPEVEKRVLPPDDLRHLIFRAAHWLLPADRSVLQIRAARGWERFYSALGDALGAVPLHPTGTTVMPGEVYVATWAAPGGLFRAKVLRARLGVNSRTDVVLAKYWPVFKAKVEPTIDLAAPLADLLAAYPVALDMAARWRVGSPGGDRHSIGASAVRVMPERIEDMARLLVRLIQDGRVRGVALAPGHVKRA